jgi:hypothetical protein
MSNIQDIVIIRNVSNHSYKLDEDYQAGVTVKAMPHWALQGWNSRVSQVSVWTVGAGLRLWGMPHLWQSVIGFLPERPRFTTTTTAVPMKNGLLWDVTPCGS